MKEDIKRLRGSVPVGELNENVGYPEFKTAVEDLYIRKTVEKVLIDHGKDINDYYVTWNNNDGDVSVELIPKSKNIEIEITIKPVDTHPTP